MARKRTKAAKNNKPAPALDSAPVMVPGPKLRKMLGINAVTLWRWRHNKRMGFPAAKTINGRLYFPLAEVQLWLQRLPQAA